MDTKNPVSYFFIIGMIFSLLWFFVDFWLSLGISFLIAIALFVRTLVISQAIPTSLTSKLPPLSIKTISWALSAIAAISIIVITIIILLQSDSSQTISFENGGSIETDKVDDDILWINGIVVFKNIDTTAENLDEGFYIGGIRKGETVDFILTLEDGTQECILPFSVGYSSSSKGYPGTKVSFEITRNSIMHETRHEGCVRVFIDGTLWTVGGEMPMKYFVLSGQKFNATMEIKTDRSGCQDKIGLRGFEFDF